jgi:hypothetical protein
MTLPFLASKFLACVTQYSATFSNNLNVPSEKQFADYKYNIEILGI